MIIGIFGLLLALVLLLGAKKLINSDLLIHLGRILLSSFSWFFGTGLFAAIIYFAVHFKLLPGAIFFLFLILFFISKNRKDLISKIVDYSPIEILKRPIHFFSLIGLFVSGGLMVSIWLMIVFSE